MAAPFVRIVVADDHALVRDGLQRVLESDPRFLVVGEADTGREAIRLVSALTPDLLLLDVSMPEVTGLEALRQITATTPKTKVIILTAAIDRATVIDALQRGARGVVLKSAGRDLLFKAIQTVLAGQYWVERDAVADLVGLIRELNDTAATSRHPFHLTDRQLDIVERVVRGMTNRQIATDLSISEETVKHHLTQIFNKTGVSSRLELALLATRRGLLDTADRVR